MVQIKSDRKFTVQDQTQQTTRPRGKQAQWHGNLASHRDRKNWKFIYEIYTQNRDKKKIRQGQNIIQKQYKCNKYTPCMHEKGLYKACKYAHGFFGQHINMYVI